MQADAQSKRSPADADAALKSDGGGGTSGGGMEARLAKLEAQMEHVQADLTKLGPVPADVSALRVTVDNLPTKDYVSDAFKTHLHYTLGIVGAMITIATLIL